MNRAQILIVDDHVVVREGLKRILQEEGEFSVAAEAGDVADALLFLRRQPFDLMILDISLPRRSGLELLKLAKIEFPQLPILVLSAYAEDHYAVRAFKDGADGYLNKESAPELLVQAIRKLLAGGKYLSPALAERIASEIGSKGDRPAYESLSDREFQILKMLANGASIKLIAEQLNISPKTVSTYRARIVEKTGLHSNAELARYVLENNLLK
ncbi:MAG TPA: response regulator transcription factor [Burkholderiales bacterium]|nr:response regulator transcription factor [Burkholderiales bacterium]